MDCLFCSIVGGDIPADKVYEDERVLAFRDISPQAPVHVLIIPKNHIACADELTDGNAGVVAHIFALIPKLAAELGLEHGYRVINNCGAHGKQSVHHLHFHLLGGRELGERLV